MINNRDLESTIVSTRVRLARNIAGYPFPSKLKNTEQAKEIPPTRSIPRRAAWACSISILWMQFPISWRAV